MAERTTFDKPTCNCGVFGIYGADDAAIRTYYGLHSLQHRGQEAAGIITSTKDDKKRDIFITRKNFGLVSEIFGNEKIFTEVLVGKSAIGHNRYSTTGASDSIKNIQPFVVNYRMGNLAIAHNGNLTNARKLRDELVHAGSLFQTTSDTEVILHLVARSRQETQIEQIMEALRTVTGAFSIVIMTDDKIIAARDVNGFKPLCIGKKNGAYIVTSETCALDINTAEYIRDVKPGEMVVIDDDVLETGNIKSYNIFKDEETPKHCVFEYIYFSRPDSRIFGSNVDKMRRKLGKELANNHPVVDPDGEKVVVISVPDSSNTAAIGYANQLKNNGISAKHEIGLIRSHYIGRTFIQPGQHKREVGVRIKFNTVKGVLEGKTIVLIDDSIVRGTTSKQLVSLIKEANPKSIHLRISSPPISHPCFYGMDFPSKEELIANQHNSIKEIGDYLGVDSLEYLTPKELLDAMVDHNREHFCTACFTGHYPVAFDAKFTKVE